MIRAVLLSDGQPPKLLEQWNNPLDLTEPHNGYTWVSLENATDDEIKNVLGDIFQFHPLAVEDCQSSGYQPAKIDDYSDYVFIIAHAINNRDDITNLETIEIDLFLGHHFLVSCYTNPEAPPIENTWNLLQKDYRISKFGPEFLCHTILDSIVDDYMPIIDQLENDVELLEDSLLEKPSPSILQSLLNLKHTIITLRRIIAPQREVMNRLSRDEFLQINKHSLIYFRDIYDHLVRIQDLTDIIRDIVSGALDIYLNSTSLRLNEIMKALTIVSTIFLPLSFVAGLFGMNFQHIPGTANINGFLFTSILLGLLGILMLVYFRKRGWF